MTDEKRRFLREKFRGNIDDVDLNRIDSALVAIDDSMFEVLNSLKLKSKTVTILFSILLSIFTRFYLGDIGFAIFRLVAVIGLSLLCMLPVMNIISPIIIFVWVIVEIVLCIKRVKYINCKSILRVLNNK